MTLNPQAEQMADESMVRNLRAQIEAIWPQERALLARVPLASAPKVLDVGCGTGEWAARWLAERADARLVGVDLIAAHLELARRACGFAGERARFEEADAYALPFADDSFDLVSCRHVVQAVGDASRLVAELVRVCKPGGWVHLVAEDYGLMTFHPTRLDSDEFWRRGAQAYGKAVGCDLLVGRKAPALLAAAGLVDVRMEPIVVDTLRVPRPTFADIWRAWRDGYTDVLAEKTELTRAQIAAHWADMIACIESPEGYGCWLLPAVTGRKPQRA